MLEDLFNAFVEVHQKQLESSGLPKIYWNSLFTKLHQEIFDAGDYFEICPIGKVGRVDNYIATCNNSDGLKLDNSNGVFLIDHAWTYKVNEARNQLSEYDSLLNRMCSLMCIKDLDNMSKEAKIEMVFETMWMFNQTYKLSTEKLTDEEREPLWYIMDEFGSSISHSSQPTVKCSPFYYLPTQVMFTIMWPIQDLNEGDELTRDYVYRIKDEQLRKAKLVPWENCLDSEDCFEAEENSDIQQEPDLKYFNIGREDEILPDINNLKVAKALTPTDVSKIKVYTDLESVRTNLTDEKFCHVDDIAEADIIFIRKHFKDYKALNENSPNSLVNQFPYENVINVKDLLAIVCRRVPDSKKWLPITYNLNYEMPKFISYFKKRLEDGEDNHWILKPWNLARSIDMTVTKNLNQIIRSQETGPKIACKYITDPVLFYRDEIDGKVKFDIRYIVLLRSVKPLTLYVYNVFWLRFANKPYSLENLDDYEKHFTVMNYRPVNLKQVNCDEFVPLFEEQNPDFKWNVVQDKIFKMIRQVFEAATMESPPKGIGSNPQSRAMYAIDLMLDWKSDENGSKKNIIEPMICEVNFMPDCTRACKYHPYFFNDVFNTLFLDCNDHQHTTQI